MRLKGKRARSFQVALEPRPGRRAGQAGVRRAFEVEKFKMGGAREFGSYGPVPAT